MWYPKTPFCYSYYFYDTTHIFLDTVHTAELSSSRNSKQALSVYKKYKTQDKWNSIKLLSVILLTEWKYLYLVHTWTQKEQEYYHICLIFRQGHSDRILLLFFKYSAIPELQSI